MRVPYDAIAEARLILTDDLIRDALVEGQQARARKPRERRGEPDDGARGCGSRRGRRNRTGTMIERPGAKVRQTSSGEIRWLSAHNRLELLQIADAVAREKSIDKSDRHRRHGRCDPEGGALALRPGEPTSAPTSTRTPAR